MIFRTTYRTESGRTCLTLLNVPTRHLEPIAASLATLHGEPVTYETTATETMAEKVNAMILGGYGAANDAHDHRMGEPA